MPEAFLVARNNGGVSWSVSMMDNADIKLSIIIPVFNEASVLPRLIKDIKDILDKSGNAYELIFIDDGSEDSTWDVLNRVARSSDRIRAIRFTRNFGKEAAIQAGLRLSRGKAAIIMDADLEHPPELLLQMISLWEKEGYDVVEGVKTCRQKETFMSKAGSTFFYKTLSVLTGYDMKKDTDYKLLDRKVVDLYLSLREQGRFFRALIPYLGFKTARLPFNPGNRREGRPGFSFLKRCNLAITAITSFSSLPLHVVTLLGVLTLLFSFFLGVQTFYKKLNGEAVEGFTTVIVIILIIGSILMIALGIIGEYIARIFEEIKDRPPFVIAETLNSETQSDKGRD
jgi:dolichol-phosphate mannosyltransferase